MTTARTDEGEELVTLRPLTASPRTPASQEKGGKKQRGTSLGRAGTGGLLCWFQQRRCRVFAGGRSTMGIQYVLLRIRTSVQ